MRGYFLIYKRAFLLVNYLCLFSQMSYFNFNVIIKKINIYIFLNYDMINIAKCILLKLRRNIIKKKVITVTLLLSVLMTVSITPTFASEDIDKTQNLPNKAIVFFNTLVLIRILQIYNEQVGRPLIKINLKSPGKEV